MGMHDLDGGHAGMRQFHLVVAEAAQLDPEPLIVGDDETEVPDLGDVDARVIDFGDDAIGDGEPQPR